jgi:hypothetical protein
MNSARAAIGIKEYLSAIETLLTNERSHHKETL